MGHSFLTYKNREERLNDIDIEICVYLIEDVSKASSLSLELKNQVDNWSHSVRSAAPGCIDLELDSMSGSFVLITGQAVMEQEKYEVYLQSFINSFAKRRIYRSAMALVVHRSFAALADFSCISFL